MIWKDYLKLSEIALRTDTVYSTTDSDKQPTSNLKGLLMNYFLLLEMQE